MLCRRFIRTGYTHIGTRCGGGTLVLTPTATPIAPTPTTTPPSNPGPQIASPLAPQTYPLPTGAVIVNNGAELENALRGTTASQIILNDGTYASSSYFKNECGHKLYARNLGKAVLTSGLSIGSNSCQGQASVQGLSFQVTDPTKTLESSVIHVWRGASNALLSDLTIVGNPTIQKGVEIRQSQGFKAQRIVVDNFSDYGIVIQAFQGDPQWTDIVRISDVSVSRVHRPTALTSNGTSEACLWVGAKSIIDRVQVIDCGWSGIWFGYQASGTQASNLTAGRTLRGTGIYFEHFSNDITIDGFQAGPELRIGFQCEWADPAHNSVPACNNVVVKRSIFDTTCVGAYLDEGTTRTTVTGSIFKNQRWAAIGDYRGVNNLYDLTGNDYRGISSTAKPIVYDHLYTANTICG